MKGEQWRPAASTLNILQLMLKSCYRNLITQIVSQCFLKYQEARKGDQKISRVVKKKKPRKENQKVENLVK